MQVTKITNEGEFYKVLFSPNLIERILLGKKPKTEIYRWKGERFAYFNHIKVFYRSDGAQLTWNDKIGRLLNNFTNRINF